MKFPVHLTLLLLLATAPFAAAATTVVSGDQVVAPGAKPVESISADREVAPPLETSRILPKPELSPLPVRTDLPEAEAGKPSTIPEPGVLVIFGVGLLALFRRRA